MPSCRPSSPADPVYSARRLREVNRRLHAGGLIAYPTEAVYGLGCDPLNLDAVEQLLRVKGRAPQKGLILIGHSPAQLRPFMAEIPAQARQRLEESWPGPHTWLCPAAAWVPDWLTGGSGRIALRATAHPLAAQLCRSFGLPLVSTSANRGGRPPARSALQVRQRLGRTVDLILPGDTGGLLRPTPIRDLLSGETLRA